MLVCVTLIKSAVCKQSATADFYERTYQGLVSHLNVIVYVDLDNCELVYDQ